MFWARQLDYKTGTEIVNGFQQKLQHIYNRTYGQCCLLALKIMPCCFEKFTWMYPKLHQINEPKDLEIPSGHAYCQVFSSHVDRSWKLLILASRRGVDDGCLVLTKL